MTLAGFSATNHPQQTGKRGATDAVDDRGTDQAFFDATAERFGGFTLDVAAAPHNAKCDVYFTRNEGPFRVEFLRGRMRFDRPQAVIGPKGDRPPFGCCLLIWENR